MAGGMQVAVRETARSGRRIRRPEHSFHLRTRAFALQPFMMAPVLAGETLKNMLMQSRVVTDPVKNPLIGWWKEYYWFYAKLSDIDFMISRSPVNPATDDLGHFVRMLLADPSFSVTDYDYGADNTADYAKSAQQQFLYQAIRLIVNSYFRAEQDLGTDYLLDSTHHLVGINNRGILDSAILNDAYGPVGATADVDLLGDATDATLNVSEIDLALKRYQLARANGLTDATYEDYLASFGVNVKPDRPHVPELLRYVKQWQYPSNTVEPTTGVPSSAVSWSIQERADKDRFFREPGFIVGLTCCRPKVYLSNQNSHIAGWLDRAEDWMPSVLWGANNASFKKYAQGTGPFSGIADADGYWIDMVDLYMYGDQFVNFALSETDAGLVALPTTALQKRYPQDSDIDALFVTPATKQFVREDGVCQLAIASTLRDTSLTV
jgi:hypothetical protein